MKIAHINSVYNEGSTGRIAADVHFKLLKDGHESKFYYGRGRKADDENAFRFISKAGVYLDAFLTRITGLVGYFSYFPTKRLIKDLKKFSPDVVHVHNLHGYFVNINMLLKFLKKEKIKTVFTMHDPFWFTGKCGCITSCKAYLNGCKGKCPDKSGYPKSMFFDHTEFLLRQKKELFSDFENIVFTTPSEYLKNLAMKTFLKEKDILVVNNGLDTKGAFCPRAQKENEKKLCLAVISDYRVLIKGYSYFKELAKKLTPEISFALVGDVPSEVDENIKFLGRANKKAELSEFYSMADLVVVPSKSETFSMVCAESLACGTPVVGFKAGAPEEIVPKEFGIFVEYGDIEALKGAVLKMIDKKSVLKDACIKYAKEHYDSQVMISNFYKIYGV